MSARGRWFAALYPEFNWNHEAFDVGIPAGYVRVSEWEPVGACLQWVGPSGYTMGESSPNGFQPGVLWRCRIAAVEVTP